MSGDGGSNGGDGESAYPGGVAGQGSGLDIDTIPVKSFSLTPGSGGNGEGLDGAGGGGGVTINGQRPGIPEYTQGGGYGGGGGGPDLSYDGYGFSGAVMFDFI